MKRLRQAVLIFPKIWVCGGLLLLSQVTEAQIYRFPIQPFRTAATKPVKRIKAPIDIHVWNMFGEGHFSAYRIEFNQTEEGKFRRGTTERINTLQGLAPRNMDNVCAMLLRGSVMKRIEHTAFSDMIAADYMPDDKPYDSYLETAHNLPAEQMIYLESVSWLSARETLDTFGGVIPGERVAELEGPGIGDEDSLKALAEMGDAQIRLRIRRSNLKIVRGQFLGAPPFVGALTHFRGNLPWEEQDAFASGLFVERSKAPMHFEISRLSQLETLDREAQKLIPFAASIIYHESFIWGGVAHDPESYRIYGAALDDRRAARFAKGGGFETVVQDPNSSKQVLATNLEKLFSSRDPSRVLESHAKLREFFGDDISAAGIIRGLHAYQNTFRTDLTFEMRGPNKKEDLTDPDGPIVVRDYSPARRLRVESIFGALLKKTGRSLDSLIQVLRTLPRVTSPRPFMFFQQDWGDQDWREKYAIAPVSISNLSPHKATHDSHYVDKLLIAISHSWTPDWIPEKMPLTFAFTTANMIVAEQLKSAGMRELLPSRVFSITLEQIRAHAEKLCRENPNNTTHPFLSEGYWSLYRTLVDLNGI